MAALDVEDMWVCMLTSEWQSHYYFDFCLFYLLSVLQVNGDFVTTWTFSCVTSVVAVSVIAVRASNM